MIGAAVLMYGLSSLRDLARKGLLTKGDPATNERIIDLPVSADDIITAAEANKDTIDSYYDKREQETNGAALLSVKSSLQGDQKQELVVFDDDSKNELVYGIEINQ